MDREPENARYCSECGKMHPAEEGDFWAESSMLGLKITYFALMQGKVFDITGELDAFWAYIVCLDGLFSICQHVLMKHEEVLELHSSVIHNIQ